MCGIVGIIGRQDLTREQYESFIKAWIQASERGTDAAGAIMSDNDGVSYWKQPGPINKTAKVFRHVYPYKPGIKFLLGHTRLGTSGSPSDNLNNHPIVTKGKTLLGIHNGIITNKDELFKKKGWQEAREVDTEAIYKLIAYYGPDNLKPLKMLEGSFNLAYCHVSMPQRFYLVKKDNPLEIVTGNGYFAFGSMGRYWDGLKYKRRWEMSNNTVYRVNRKSFDLRKFEPIQSYGYWTYHQDYRDRWGRNMRDDKETTGFDNAGYIGGYFVDPNTGTIERREGNETTKRVWPED